MKTKEEKLKALSEFLRHKHLEYSQRCSKVLSEADMARMHNFPIAAYNNWTNGTREPTGEYLHRLADAYGIEIYNILEERIPVPDDPVLIRLVSKWEGLPDDQKNAITKLIKELE